MMRRAALGILVLLAVVGGLWVMVFGLWDGGGSAEEGAPALQISPAVVARGEYLARVGNCMGCHTAQGGAPFAGGRAIATPFGVVHASNLTPDAGTGLGAWTDAEFWRALHHGRSRDGRLLSPAFPFTSYTWVTREDSDALYAYLRSLPPVVQANRPHALRFPYGSQAGLAVWRALFFRPQSWQADAGRSPEWNRGAYLVQGLGHCAACHTPRNALGASEGRSPLGGGLVGGAHWYAPALIDPAQAGLQEWPLEDIVALLRTGAAPHGSVSGPMAEVVVRSTQYLSDADARAMAVYLRDLPVRAVPRAPPPAPASAVLQRGEALYAQHCAQCHGAAGEGVAGAFPALSGNRAVLLDEPVNLVQVILQGGFLPATTGNPRPHGMPPFMHQLGDEDVADVLTYVRNAWGNRALPVGTIDVYRIRERGGF